MAQVQRAQPVDDLLDQDAARDFFFRGKNLYDAAQKSADNENRLELYQRAAEIFSQYLSEFPNHPNAEPTWWYLGNSFYQSGRINDAKRCFSTLLNRYGKGKWAAAAAYTLAADHYNRGEYAFAAPLFQRYAENAAKPEDRPRGNYFAGNCYRLLGRDREAIGAFLRVLEDPAGGLFAPQAKVALGAISLRAGDFATALKYFEEIVVSNEAAKVRGEAALNAGVAAMKLNQPELSEKYLQLVLTSPGMDDFRPDAQTALMENAFSQKNYDRVIEIFRASVVKAKDDKEAARLMVAARAYMRMKRPSEAMGLFREIERLSDPDSENAFNAAYLRLLCFFQIEGKHVPDQVDAFLQLYRKSRADDPRIHTALMLKAESLFTEKKIEDAAKTYSEVQVDLITESNRPGLLYKRGWCLAEAEEPQGAIRSLSDFIQRYPQDKRVLSAVAKRAESYVKISEAALALADFDQLTKAEDPALRQFAWLESARLSRAENKIEDMSLRYEKLLSETEALSDARTAEANYWIGWGKIKLNKAKEAVPYLEKARKLRPKVYAKHAGILLALGYFAAQQVPELAAEIETAIRGGYHHDIPKQAIQWSGMQSWNSGNPKAAAVALESIADPDEPKETSKEIWRYLAKARLETRDAKGALQAVNYLLDVEDQPAWKADALLDRGRSLYQLEKFSESRKAVDEGMALGPQGRTSGGLRILTGDLDVQDKEFGKAAAAFLYVVQFHEDADLKPIALSKLIDVHLKQSNAAEAKIYQDQLAKEFPDWKPR